MDQGRGNSAMIALVLLLFCMLVFHSEIARADTYTVGDAGGWTFNVDNWPNGKQFEEGDTFVFNYNPKFHNVVKVDEAGYNACTVSKEDKVFQSGNDKMMLRTGKHYFICSFPGHCQRGTKVALNVL